MTTSNDERQFEKMKALTLEIAKGNEYIDYWSDTICSHCHQVVSEDGHSEDCDMLVARKILGKEWTEYEKKEEERIKNESFGAK